MKFSRNLSNRIILKSANFCIRNIYRFTIYIFFLAEGKKTSPPEGFHYLRYRSTGMGSQIALKN